MFTGNIASVSPPSSTPRTTLTQSNYLPHGHTSTFSVARRIKLIVEQLIVLLGEQIITTAVEEVEYVLVIVILV